MTRRVRNWNLKTRLEKILLLSLFLVSILLVGILSVFVVRITQTNLYCKTPACISAANTILSYINRTADPCENFFLFACGNFINENTAGYHRSKPLKERIKLELEKLMKEPIHEDDHYLVKNQKILFRSCMNETENKEDNLNYFKNVVKNLNGWPLLDGTDWNETTWEEVTFKLGETRLHYSSFLDVKVDSDPYNVTNTIVHISDAFTLHLNEMHKHAYVKYVADSIKYLGSKTEDVQKDILEMYDFNIDLIEITNKNNYNSDNITEQILLRRFTVKDFQKRNNQIDWLRFINKILKPIAEISENDYVFFPTQEYVESFFELLNSTTERVKVNFIIWNLFSSLAHYFPRKLENLEMTYSCSVNNGYLNQVKPSERCRNMLHKSFEFIPTDMVYVQKSLGSRRKNKVQKLTTYVKYEFRKFLESAPWLDDRSKERSIKKLDKLTVVLGNEDYFRDPVLKMFENRTLRKDAATMALYVQSRQLLVDMQYAQLSLPGNHNKFRIINRNANTINANYMADRNIIGKQWYISIVLLRVRTHLSALFAGILQNTYFDPDRSQYLNYGSLGTVIGHELTHGFCKFASEYDAYGDRSNTWTNYTSHSFDVVTQCVLQEVDDFQIEGTGLKMNATKTLEENIADITGLKVAYNAYRQWVRDNSEELPLIGLNYTSYQLFWISSVLDYCYEMDKDDVEDAIKYDLHAVNVFRVNIPLKNNMDFAIDFNCPVNSAMNPLNKCVVF